MPKELRLEGEKGPPVCSVCGHTHPWHSIACPKMAGKYCMECEMLLPRHYPWCSIGQHDGFFAWSAPRSIQHEVELAYNQHMKNRIAQKATGGE